MLAIGTLALPADAELLDFLNGSFYKEDFNSLPTSGTVDNSMDLPRGFAFNETDAGSTTAFAADYGSSAAGNTYDYGTTGNTDRALGELTASTLVSKLGAGFINRTGFVITRLTLGYTGEQWWIGAADANLDRLDFQISMDATGLTTGSWTEVNSLDFVSPIPINAGAVGAKDGNAAANCTGLPDILASTTPIPNNETFWIRWLATDITGNDDGLAIDDFTLRTNPIADFDLDGDVDGADGMILQRNFGTATGASISLGDADADGTVDALDYAVWRNAFGNDLLNAGNNSGSGTGSGVGSSRGVRSPKPTSFVMLALAATGFLVVRSGWNRPARIGLVSAALFLSVNFAQAQNVSLSLNVFPSTLAAPNSGGSWTLVAKTNSTFGISAVSAYMSGISAAGISYGPGINAALNGGNPFIDNQSPALSLFYFQDTTVPGLVFGVGTAGFSQAQVDPFGDPAFNASTRIATGTYNSSLPAFVTSGNNVTDANLFSTNSSSPTILDANTTFVVRVLAAVNGDYNVNGSVDAADYVRWRKNNGTNNALPNDAIGPPIGPAQYSVWRNRFGLFAGSGSGADSFAAVPEPAAGMLLISAIAGCCLQRRRASAKFCRRTNSWILVNLAARNRVLCHISHFFAPMSLALSRIALVVSSTLRRCGGMRRITRLLLIAGAWSAFFAPVCHAQLCVFLTGGAYRQNFNALPTTGTSNNSNSLPQGFAFSEAGTGGTLTYSADNGSLATGNTYSYGTTGSTDRALGELTSGTVESTLGACFLNDTGLVIPRLTLSYTGEMWRLGAADAIVDRLDFQFSTNATSIVDEGPGVVWTDVNTLDFVSPNNTAPAGAKDGNAAANRTTTSPIAIIPPVGIPDGSVFYIRWLSTAAIGGVNDGLAIDDILLTYAPSADFDLDGDIDGADGLVLQRNLGTASGASISTGDANRDGAVDLLDLAIWKHEFGAIPAFGAGSGSGAGSVAGDIVPEPATVHLIGLVAAGLAQVRSGRRHGPITNGCKRKASMPRG